MRFAANIPPRRPPRAPASEQMRGEIPSEPRPQVQPATPRTQELPVDLDQRVRLVGEW